MNILHTWISGEHVGAPPKTVEHVCMLSLRVNATLKDAIVQWADVSAVNHVRSKKGYKLDDNGCR